MKRWSYTILTFLGAVTFIFCSITGMNRILENVERKLLSERGSMTVESPVQTWQDLETDGEGEGGEHTLTLEQIDDAYTRWHFRGMEIVHDPVEGQISIKQAIEMGEEWLSAMQDKNSWLDLGQDISAVNAILGVGMQQYDEEQKAPYYSFWTVRFSGRMLVATLYLNAVTGKVWGAELLLYKDISQEDLLKSLYSFRELTGIERLDSEEPHEFTGKNRATLTWNDGIDIQVDYDLSAHSDAAGTSAQIAENPYSNDHDEDYAFISYNLVTERGRELTGTIDIQHD